MNTTITEPLVISDQKMLAFVFSSKKNLTLLDAVTETLSVKGLHSLTDTRIEDVLCASSLCASE